MTAARPQSARADGPRRVVPALEIQSHRHRHPLVLYTAGRPQRALTAGLLERGIHCAVIDLAHRPDLALEITARSGRRAFPQLFAAGDFIAGARGVEALAGSGTLERKPKPACVEASRS